MGLSAPSDDSVEVIVLYIATKLISNNTVVLSDTWADSIDIISLTPDKKTRD